jgi:hypothetical protein
MSITNNSATFGVVAGSPFPHLEGSDFGPVPKTVILKVVCGKL